jgi:hypothetical protein
MRALSFLSLGRAAARRDFLPVNPDFAWSRPLRAQRRLTRAQRVFMVSCGGGVVNVPLQIWDPRVGKMALARLSR